MKFLSLNFKEGDPRLNGLKKIELNKKPLGDVIALVGRNGSGKSRILNCIKNYAKQLTVEDILENKLDTSSISTGNNFSFSNLDSQIEAYKKQRQRTKENIKQNIQSNFLPTYKNIIDTYIKPINLEHYTKILKPPKVFSLENLFKSSNSENEFNLLFTEITISYLQKLSDELNLDRYNHYFDQTDIIESKSSYQKFEKLQKYIELFLRKKISSKAKKIESGQPFSSELIWDNHLFDQSKLSPGEKILFSYAILFYLLDINSINGISDCVIVIDEPENHLHPSAQIQLVSAIKEIIKGKGQLWIATHSLPLVSSFEFDEIFLVKENEVLDPGRLNPGNSISELMDSEDNIYKMRELLISSSDWAYANFMAQCFSNPEAFFYASTNDLQIKDFYAFIKNKQTLKILDFGAGKGRLAKAIQETESIKSNIEYYSVLEPNNEFTRFLKSIPIVKNIYNDSETIPSNSFDLVLLFNVLHEINPEKWVEIFKSVKNSLKDDGYLVIVEDKFLPKGEKIEKYGYIILNEYQILDLFGIQHDKIDNHNPLKKNNNNRITFSVIPKQMINVTNKSILNAIENLNKEMLGKMEEIRNIIQTDSNKTKKDLSIGRLYAHYSQLYINTTFALKYLPSSLTQDLVQV